MTTYLVTIPAHGVAYGGSSLDGAPVYELPASEHLVGAACADDARVEAASRAHRDARVPPYRSLVAQTAERARAVVHETAAAERARKMRERSA